MIYNWKRKGRQISQRRHPKATERQSMYHGQCLKYPEKPIKRNAAEQMGEHILQREANQRKMVLSINYIGLTKA